MMETPTKTCVKCGVVKPATIEFFYFNKPYKKLINRCRECNKIASQSWKERHQKEFKEYRDNYYLENHETILAKDKIKRVGLRDWYLEYNRNYYREHRQERLDKHFVYRLDKRQHLSKQSADYAKANPEKRRLQESKRRARIKGFETEFTIANWEYCLSYFNHCCAYCSSQNGFWNPIHADHLIPLAASNCPGTISTNMIPACRSCNSSKHNHEVKEWVIRIFGKRKATKILNRINAYITSLKDHV